MEMSSKANRRAVWASVVPWERATSWAMRFQTVTLVRGSRQTRAASVWSGVRAVLLRLPSALTSLKAAAYSGLVKAGGGGGRNWALLATAKGVMSGTWALAAGAKFGGVGCHWPGSVLGGV